MSAERLRAAAKVLRERAEATTLGPWYVTRDPLGVHVENGDGIGRIAMAVGEDRPSRTSADAAFIATMDPPVARALADWLDDHASVGESWSRRGGVPYIYDPAALRVADLIRGGEQS